jgi:hypothetical protein
MTCLVCFLFVFFLSLSLSLSLLQSTSRYQISWFLGHLEVRIWFKNSSFQPDLSIYRRREYFDTI